MEMFHLQAKERRWCSNLMHSDVYMACADGQVQAHSARLSELSFMLSSLLENRACANCKEPSVVVLPDFKVADCKAMIELIYTGGTNLVNTKVERVVALCRSLGIQLANVFGDFDKEINFRFTIDFSGDYLQYLRNMTTPPRILDKFPCRVFENRPSSSRITNRNGSPYRVISKTTPLVTELSLTSPGKKHDPVSPTSGQVQAGKKRSAGGNRSQAGDSKRARFQINIEEKVPVQVKTEPEVEDVIVPPRLEGRQIIRGIKYLQAKKSRKTADVLDVASRKGAKVVSPNLGENFSKGIADVEDKIMEEIEEHLNAEHRMTKSSLPVMQGTDGQNLPGNERRVDKNLVDKQGATNNNVSYEHLKPKPDKKKRDAASPEKVRKNASLEKVGKNASASPGKCDPKLVKCWFCDKQCRQLSVHFALFHLKEQILKKTDQGSCRECQYKAEENELILHIAFEHMGFKNRKNSFSHEFLMSQGLVVEVPEDAIEAAKSCKVRTKSSESANSKPAAASKVKKSTQEKPSSPQRVQKTIVPEPTSASPRVQKTKQQEPTSVKIQKAEIPTPQVQMTPKVSKVDRSDTRLSKTSKKPRESNQKPAVREAFIVNRQWRAKRKEAVARRQGNVGCGTCVKCKMPDCGECIFCQDHPKFGGKGKMNKVCVKKVCRNK